MKLRTPEEVFDAVSAELAWRKKELIALESLLVKKKGTQFEEPLIRAAVALLYAHWEGFIRAAGGAYLSYVALRRLRYGDLATHFVAHWVRAQVVVSEGHPVSLEACARVTRTLRDGLHTVSALPSRDELVTTGNLSSKVLRDIVAVLGFDYSAYETKEKLIDEGLLGSRNSIAHGRKVEMSVAVYLGLHREILDLIATFGDQIEDGVSMKRYRREMAAPAEA